MPILGVNIDHIATLREVRHGVNPEPAAAAMICEASGADSIVAHLREDRRHIREEDLYLLKKVVRTRLNLEMSCAKEIVDIARKIKPDQATLVPEKRQELTTEGGLDVIAHFRKVRDVAAKLKDTGIDVSLFIDPDEEQIGASAKTGVHIIELHTGRYADAKNRAGQDKYFRQIEKAVRCGISNKLTVNAGHGLDYHNVSRIAKIKGIEELNIGYSIVCRAALVGLSQAVMEMKELIG